VIFRFALKYEGSLRDYQGDPGVPKGLPQKPGLESADYNQEECENSYRRIEPPIQAPWQRFLWFAATLTTAVTITFWSAAALFRRHYFRWWGGLAAGIILAQLAPVILRHGAPWTWPW
jgi:hypothetical protein